MNEDEAEYSAECSDTILDSDIRMNQTLLIMKI